MRVNAELDLLFTQVVENGFVAAIQQSYNHHQHLRISPDDVWLAMPKGTSTSASITASRVILLDSMKKYFTYKMRCMCGIPKVTFEGSLQDWQKLREKVVKLRELGLDMDFWLDRLEPVVWKLVETYRGGGAGMPVYWDGWISAFFPYDNTGHKLTKNSIEATHISNGQVNVPFKTDIGFDLSFVAGFLGAQQVSFGEGDETEAIFSPVIGWTK
ncbi:hypothetical protein G9A89_011521 [Geosiphon pyriformis]|nr:hypothetical protein G9A89_011521 [Geosiphon pyriformis]